MGTSDHPAPTLPPRWFIHTAWRAHRALVRGTGARLGLARPKPGKAGLLRLHTVGRRTGKERAVMLAYVEDGARLVTLAMNGWGDPPPAWWLNLLAHPDATVDLVDGTREVRGREAEGEERRTLWAMLQGNAGWGADLDALAGLRSHRTPVVLLEPADPPG